MAELFEFMEIIDHPNIRNDITCNELTLRVETKEWRDDAWKIAFHQSLQYHEQCYQVLRGISNGFAKVK